jgi:hypothetical protein
VHVQSPFDTALPPGRDSAAARADEEIRPLPGALLIPLSRLERDPDQPRHDGRLHETQERVAEHVALVRTDALVGRERPDKPGHYVVVAGRMRFYAAVRAGLTAVPAGVRNRVFPGRALAQPLQPASTTAT